MEGDRSVEKIRLEDENRTLRNSVAELTDFIENAAIPLHWVNAEGIIIWANQAELDALGYAPQEYIGASIRDFHADTNVIDDILARLTNNETLYSYPASLRCKDGTIKHVLISSNVLMKEGKFIHTRCFTKDVTEIVQQEKKGAELAAIVRTSYDAIVSKSLEGEVMTWNAAAERMFGYSAAEMIGHSILKIIPQDRKDEESYILRRLRKGETVEHFETKRRMSNGNLLDVSLTISPIKNNKGEIIGISKIIRDITDKKQEERRKNDFISMVSHELKTPLTSILLYAQVLNKKSEKNQHIVAPEMVKKIEIQAKKMITMIGDFLSLTRLEEGKIHLRFEIFKLCTLINEIADDAALLNVSRRLKVVGDNPVKVYADRDKIGQVLANLVSNALKYSPAGGEVTIGCERKNGKLKIFVSDQGIGISKAEQRNLFQRFYRADDDACRNISGFGIGLFLVSEILQYHGSKIHVESEKGRGSLFFFFMDQFKEDVIPS